MRAVFHTVRSFIRRDLSQRCTTCLLYLQSPEIYGFAPLPEPLLPPWSPSRLVTLLGLPFLESLHLCRLEKIEAAAVQVRPLSPLPYPNPAQHGEVAANKWLNLSADELSRLPPELFARILGSIEGETLLLELTERHLGDLEGLGRLTEPQPFTPNSPSTLTPTARVHAMSPPPPHPDPNRRRSLDQRMSAQNAGTYEAFQREVLAPYEV